jgi:hypothetical protein
MFRLGRLTPGEHEIVLPAKEMQASRIRIVEIKGDESPENAVVLWLPSTATPCCPTTVSIRLKSPALNQVAIRITVPGNGGDVTVAAGPEARVETVRHANINGADLNALGTSRGETVGHVLSLRANKAFFEKEGIEVK